MIINMFVGDAYTLCMHVYIMNVSFPFITKHLVKHRTPYFMLNSLQEAFVKCSDLRQRYLHAGPIKLY